MKKAEVFVLIFLVYLLSYQREIGFIEKSKGEANRAVGEEQELLKRGDILMQNDRISTSAGGYIKMRFSDNDGYALLMGESEASLALYSLSDKNEKVVNLKSGALFASADKSKFRIETVNSVALFDSAEVYAEILKDTVKIICKNGRVKIESEWGESSLAEGEQVFIANKETPFKTKIKINELNLFDMTSETDVLEIEIKNSKGETRRVIIEVE